MSMRIIAMSSSNREVGQALGQFGLADAAGTEEEEAAGGRFGSLMPARLRRTASATALTARCPMRRLPMCSSMWSLSKAGDGELVFRPNRGLPPPDAVPARAEQPRCS